VTIPRGISVARGRGWRQRRVENESSDGSISCDGCSHDSGDNNEGTHGDTRGGVWGNLGGMGGTELMKGAKILSRYSLETYHRQFSQGQGNSIHQRETWWT